MALDRVSVFQRIGDGPSSRHLLVVGRQLNGNFNLLRNVIGGDQLDTRIQPGFPLEHRTEPENSLSLWGRTALATNVGRSVAIIGLATPNFWLGVMVMIYPAIWWGWTPPLKLVRFFEHPLQNLSGFLIPALILGTASAAAVMRMTRTMMLEVLRQDYIRTAWAKGARERVVVVRHALKNALIPVVTLVGLQLPILVGGAVIMENICNLPGLGRLMLLALQDRDYPVVSGE